MISFKLANTVLLLIILTSISYSQNSWDDYVSKAWGGNYSPYIEANAGYGTPNHVNISGAFEQVGTVELKFGFTELKKYKKYIQSLDNRYVFATKISSDLINSASEGSDKIRSEMWRFGIGNRLGFGYEIGAFSLIPYHQMALTITKPEFSDTNAVSHGDIEVLNRLQGDYRMGMTYEGGVQFYIAKSVSFNAGVEGAIIFPRYQVMKWAGSYALQAISLGAVSYFSEAIVNSSPFLGPIMYFVLKNGIAAAWYFAMKDQMYWPIDSEAPLAMETFRVGASFTF
jgi:hypothetical protein